MFFFSVGCPPGTDSIPPSSQLISGMTPTTCSIYNPTCPANYNCQYSYKINNFICCGTPQVIVNPGGKDRMWLVHIYHSVFLIKFNFLLGCPPGLVGYTNPQTGQFQTCTPGMTSCPQPYFCQYSSTLSQYVCCGSSNPQPGRQVSGSCHFINLIVSYI